MLPLFRRSLWSYGGCARLSSTATLAAEKESSAARALLFQLQLGQQVTPQQQQQQHQYPQQQPLSFGAFQQQLYEQPLKHFGLALRDCHLGQHWRTSLEASLLNPASRATCQLPTWRWVADEAFEGLREDGIAMECKGRRSKGSWGHRRDRGGMKGKRR
ncbi:unnamed protein product [Polarella glacialis]|uniref:Uncharacterized protein n=1 Tax=Polarella glacialis TaxID=89957 RepID=A0A813J4H3_POLGL|nr:unnamed protein product [Polarella glacialis]